MIWAWWQLPVPQEANIMLRCCPPCRLVNGTRDLLRQQRGLAHHANYHEFCRLLGRLKANYQLSELVSGPDCPPHTHHAGGGGGDAAEDGKKIWLTRHSVRTALLLFFSSTLSTHLTSQHLRTQTPHPGRWVQVGLESYKEWIQLAADFTISSLNSWQWASGSVYYLLGLW